MNNILFRPVKGKENAILSLDNHEGSVYFATDTGKIYIDTEGKRIPVGGSGSGSAGASIYWGKDDTVVVKDQETDLYKFPVDGLTSLNIAKTGDIIINSDGKFYRVHETDEEYYWCSLLAISGTGNVTEKVRPTLTTEDLLTQDLINGQEAKLYFTAKSAVINNIELSKRITVKWQLSVINNDYEEVYYKDQKTVDSGVRDFINFGEYLRDSTISVLTLWASANNHEEDSYIQTIDIKTSSLELNFPQGFSYLHKYDPDKVVLSCDAIGNTAKILDFYFDNEKVHSVILKSTDATLYSYTVPRSLCTHGSHKVKIELHQSIDGVYGLGVKPLSYEIAVKEAGNTKPIIWLGEYQSEYYNYDNIQIPYTVFDPLNTLSTNVHLYKNGIEIEGSPVTLTNFDDFTYWEIADADLDQLNQYSISCGEEIERKVTKDITFTVVKDPNRSMELSQKDYLVLNFNPIGRTNSESPASRKKWEFIRNGVKHSAIFENFNWYNNGWIMDPVTKQTCLRISNGATFKIPFGDLKFATSNNAEESNTIEIQFKMRNVQKYQNLITNITRYWYIKKGTDEKIEDFQLYNDYLDNKANYINYDAYLQRKLWPEEYESLEYRALQKDINLDSVVMQFFTQTTGANVIGTGIGPQDVFFSNGTNTVSVSYVEEDIINLSFVYNHSQKLMFVYINGCISGVIRSTATTDFTISSDIIFNSNICDIDLYGIRIYNTGLGVKDICYNYAVDRKDIKIWDQTALATYNSKLDEYQIKFEGDDSVSSYNTNNPKEPLMPYIIYDTLDYEDNKTPWSKATVRNIKVEFVNTPLDRAYANGELVSLAEKDGLITINENTTEKAIQEAVKTYYKHHCPSFTSTLSANDRVEFVVQGTSSEFYPRRNFKIKTKVKENVWDESVENEDGTTGAFKKSSIYNIYMNKGPFADIYNEDAQKVIDDDKYYGHEACRLSDGWYMNNYTNATDRWTMKVDYMESSGSYNAGLAGLVGNAYSKHPLSDYLGVINGEENLHSAIATLSRDIRWEDYRTSLLGFPVMAFQRRYLVESDGSIDYNNTEYIFIGYYRMLLDKGSDKVLGFDTSKKITSTFIKDAEGNPKALKDIAECWEFSNNARTFCSFIDPWKRVKLSFTAPIDGENELIGYNPDKPNEVGTLAPFVTDHFEYRYHWAEDYLDALLTYSTQSGTDLTTLIDDLNKEKARTKNYDYLQPYSSGGIEAAREAAKVTLSFYENYEKLCAWIYSCNVENVPSAGSYSEIKSGVAYDPNKTYYIIVDNEYIEDTSKQYQEDTVYYERVEDESGVYYQNANVALKEKYIYKKNIFYQKINGVYSLVSDDTFDSNIIYYEFISKDLTEDTADLLVELATTHKENEIYYTYDASKIINPEGKTGAVTRIGTLSKKVFDAGTYYVAAPVTYSGITHHFDTKEYRAAKFINELNKHFDEEYVATYFVVTEILECYDSRGKNCMMASWGPQEEGGEYIWYPIFYDMDTQLGINNTGIPSFEYNVDATENKNFSTSNSVLWNNFYTYFKNSLLLNKYKQLRDVYQSKWDPLRQPPFKDVETIESWYSFDPKTTNNLACKGDRPLIITNLDMYFKYITITNPKAKLLKVSHLGQGGDFTIDQEDTYFYALQGDRSQSRQQFVINRLDYTDSWLNQKNYARAGDNYIKGRISSNNMNGSIHSDNWVADSNNPYFQDNGKKTHDFDGEYWVTLTPTKSIYVTAGEDGANYPSKRYDGTNPVKFELTGLAPGIRESKDYPEQLVYLYGTKSMADYGDLHNLYYREFVMSGEAPKLTRIKLGHDGLSQTDNGKQWYNTELNQISLIPLPLLKEMNICNLNIKTSTTLDLTQSEKLENFRATGTTNLVQVKFADGVALNTLYLPRGITTLQLIQANLLTDLITDNEYTYPEVLDDGSLKANPGLYLEGFFTGESDIALINLDGGALGYNSYRLLEQYYKNAPAAGRLSMTDVKWCPFTKVTEGEDYNSAYAYFIDNGHYQLDHWNTYNEDEYKLKILNNELYKIGPYTAVQAEHEYNSRYMYFAIENDKYVLQDITSFENILDITTLYYIDKGQYFVDDTGYAMLFKEGKDEDEPNSIRELFTGLSTSDPANITGIIYIENDNHILKEADILNGIQQAYPNVTFFFKNVVKAYSAKFVIYDNETQSYKYVKHIDGSTAIPSIQRIQEIEKDEDGNVITMFESPFTNYLPEKTHYDFQGWSLVPNPGENDIIFTNVEKDEDGNIINEDPWNTGYTINDELVFPGLIDEGQIDYTFYAIFTIHKYKLTFHNDTGTEIDNIVYVPYGEKAQAPLEIPYKNDSELDLTKTYSFQGYSLAVGGSLVDLNSITISSDEEFYANYKEMDIYDSEPHPEWFNISDGSIYPTRILKGKILLPLQVNDIDVVSISSGFSNQIGEINQQFTHIFCQKDSLITQIESSAFYRNTYLQYFDFINTNIQTIQENAFRECPNLLLDEFELNNGLQIIESFAFANSFKRLSTKIKQLRIPGTVQTVEGRAFSNILDNQINGIENNILEFIFGDSDNPSQLNLKNTYNSDDIDSLSNDSSICSTNNNRGKYIQTNEDGSTTTISNAVFYKIFIINSTQGYDTLKYPIEINDSLTADLEDFFSTYASGTQYTPIGWEWKEGN